MCESIKVQIKIWLLIVAFSQLILMIVPLFEITAFSPRSDLGPGGGATGHAQCLFAFHCAKEWELTSS